MASNDFFRELDHLRREIDEAFRGFGYTGPFRRRPMAASAPHRFPPVNLREEAGHLHVEVLVPGVDPREVDLYVMSNTLTISGERKPAAEQQGQVVHRSEILTGKFSRTIELPVDVDTDKITAECKAGVMRIVLPKAEHAKPRKVEVTLS